MTLSQFLNLKDYSSELKQIILDIALGSINVYAKINRSNESVLGSVGETNIQNEEIQKLDLIANEIFIKQFESNSSVNSILSEENDNLIHFSNNSQYIIAMDPLDGSSNIDVNIPVGSIFSILKNKPEGFLQKGTEQQLASYVIYGTTTMMVFAIENEVFGFTLNPETNQYILSHPNIITPNQGSIFSINEGNYSSIDNRIKQFIDSCKKLNSEGKRTHTGRFVGSLVADFHRNMLKGGIFIYPQTADRPRGQLRLIYECNPIAFISKCANGKSLNIKNCILDVTPSSIHQRTPFVVGSKDMVSKLLSFY